VEAQHPAALSAWLVGDEEQEVQGMKSVHIVHAGVVSVG